MALPPLGQRPRRWGARVSWHAALHVWAAATAYLSKALRRAPSSQAESLVSRRTVWTRRTPVDRRVRLLVHSGATHMGRKMVRRPIPRHRTCASTRLRNCVAQRRSAKFGAYRHGVSACAPRRRCRTPYRPRQPRALCRRLCSMVLERTTRTCQSRGARRGCRHRRRGTCRVHSPSISSRHRTRTRAQRSLRSTSSAARFCRSAKSRGCRARHRRVRRRAWPARIPCKNCSELRHRCPTTTCLRSFGA